MLQHCEYDSQILNTFYSQCQVTSFYTIGHHKIQISVILRINPLFLSSPFQRNFKQQFCTYLYCLSFHQSYTFNLKYSPSQHSKNIPVGLLNAIKPLCFLNAYNVDIRGLYKKYRTFGWQKYNYLF